MREKDSSQKYEESAGKSRDFLVVTYLIFSVLLSMLSSTTMNEPLLKTVAQTFSMSEGTLIEQGLKAFLHDQLALCNAEFETLLVKHGVRTLKEFDSLLIQNPERESTYLADFQRADFLAARMSDIKGWIAALNGNH